MKLFNPFVLPIVILLISFPLSRRGMAQWRPTTGPVHQPYVHDPCIIAADGFYYVFSTGRGVPFYRSSDLFNWTRCGTVFSANPPWAVAAVPGVMNPWAPDISLFNGSYHLYYSMSTFGKNRSCVGLTINKTLDPKSAEYRWVDQGKVFESFAGDDFNAIDPNLVFDENHVPWLALGSCWGGVRMRRLDAGTGKPSPIDVHVYSLATRPGGKLIEGPFVIRRGKWFYLFVSFDACCRGTASTYHVMVGRSMKVTGPYEDMDHVPMMRGGGSLVIAGQGDVRGPGHNAALMDVAGHDWIINHYYDATDHGRAKLQVRQMVWDDDGWPLVGEPVNEPVVGKVASGLTPRLHTELSGAWNVSIDFGEEKEIELTHSGEIKGSHTGAWHADHGRLKLQTADVIESSGDIVDEAGKWFVGRTRDGRLLRGRRK